MNWWKELKGRARLLEPLKNHTTFKIGGPAKFFVEPEDAADLKLLLGLAEKNKLPVRVIGRGSNLLISDEGIKDIVVRLSAPYFRNVSCKDNRLIAGSGALLNSVLLVCVKHGLTGAEFLTGIPGTVGGALAMNAGITEKAHSSKLVAHSMGDFVENVTVMDYRGNMKTLSRKDIKFGYRKSSLSKYIILGAVIKLKRGNRKEVRGKIKEYMDCRKISQDLSKPSAGCVFKNPPGDSAGRLIDLCGLKGKNIRGATVSVKHANFILNLGGASAKDVRRLMGLMKRKVNNRFNIDLIPEIKIWQN